MFHIISDPDMMRVCSAEGTPHVRSRDMSAIQVTVTGNLTGDPEVRYTPTGVPVATFTVASNERYKDAGGKWQDGPTSFVRVNAWRDLAEHAGESLAKGHRAVVVGVLRQRDYIKDDEKRTVWEVTASEIGAALRYATVKVTKAQRDQAPLPEDPYAAAGAPPDEPPF
jgi:single-strand DNA-binding protein